MRKRPIETILGFGVILIAAGFLAFAFSNIETKTVVQGYKIYAIFQEAGGLENGSNVQISGIKVGSVVSRTLDKDFNAKVTMVIKKDVRLPDDTTAAIMGDGLMGGKMVNLIPGKSQTLMKNGDKVAKVKDFRSLEDAVSEIIFLATKSPSSK